MIAEVAGDVRTRVPRATPRPCGRLATAIVLALGVAGMSQELQINEFGPLELRGALGPAHARFVFTDPSICTNEEAAMRGLDAGGTFTTPTELVASVCDLTSTVWDVAMLDSGAFLVAFNLGWEIGARVFDAAGAPMGQEFQVSELVGSEPNRDARVAALSSGRYAVVWTYHVPNKDIAHGRIVMEDGSMPHPTRTLPEDLTGNSSDPSAAASPTGGAAAAWRGTGDSVRFRLFDETLSPGGPEMTVNTRPCPREPLLASLPDGYVVMWTDYTADPVVRANVLGRWLDAAGSPTGAERILTEELDNDQVVEGVGGDQSGRTIVTWSSEFQDGSEAGVYARIFDTTGAPEMPEFLVNGTQVRSQYPADIAVLSDGSFIILWGSMQTTGNNTDAFMRRYFFPVSLAIAPGPAAANAPTVTLDQPDGLGTPATFQVYGSGGYGAMVGAGDLDGGLDEVLTGPGPSPVFGPHVRAFRTDASPLAKVSYYAYATLRYGVHAAGATIDADAFDEILTTPGAGEVFGPHVRGWDVDAGALRPISKISFYAYQTLKWGARVTGGDLDGDGYREIVTGPGPGQIFGPHVRGFNYDGTAIAAMSKVSIYAFSTGTHGVTVATADVESDGIGGYGDGYQEILAGRGPAPLAPAEIALFDVDGGAPASKEQRVVSTSLFGVEVAGGDVDAGDIEELVTGPGPDPAAPATVTVWEWEPGIGQTGYQGLSKLWPSEHAAFGGLTGYGAQVAVGTFE